MIKETLLATYERESTLWKNANAFYKAQDWTKMECLFTDYSEIRNGTTRFIDEAGRDVTEELNYDRYEIRFTNKRGTNTKTYSFRTRDEANSFFKQVMADKVLGNFRKVR